MLVWQDGAPQGQCTLPELEPGARYSQVAAGGAHTVLLRSDGRAIACGYRGDGQCSIPEAAMLIERMTLEADHGRTNSLIALPRVFTLKRMRLTDSTQCRRLAPIFGRHWPTFANISHSCTNKWPRLANFGPTSANKGKLWRTPAQCDRIVLSFPNFAELGQIGAKSDQYLADVGRITSKVGQHRPKFLDQIGQFCRSLPEIRQTRMFCHMFPTLGQLWPSSAKTCPDSPRFGRIWAESRLGVRSGRALSN